MGRIGLILGLGSFILASLLIFGAQDLEASEAGVLGPRPRILSFKQWKEEEATKATNRLARAKNKLVLAKKKDIKGDELEKLEKEELKCSQMVDITNEFTIEDYFVVYLTSLGNSAFILREAAKVMSDDEVAELMKVFIRSHNKDLTKSGSAWVPSFNNSASNKL